MIYPHPIRIFSAGLAAALGLALATEQSAAAARELRDIPYVEGGHERQKLDLYLPEKSSAPVPLIIWVHGGGWRGGSKDGCPPRRLGFVDRGFAVASIGYRLTDAAPFPAQIEDCRAAVRWLRSHAADHGIDPDRFVAWGSSAGGHLVALLGTAGEVRRFDVGENLGASGSVQAVIDFFGPSDLARFIDTPGYESHRSRNSPEVKLLGGTPAEKPEAARLASPISHVSAGDPPFLILHGSADPTVPVDQSEALHAALRAAGIDSELHVIAGGKHGGPEFTNAEALGWIRAFLERTVLHSR